MPKSRSCILPPNCPCRIAIHSLRVTTFFVWWKCRLNITRHIVLRILPSDHLTRIQFTNMLEIADESKVFELYRNPRDWTIFGSAVGACAILAAGIPLHLVYAA